MTEYHHEQGGDELNFENSTRVRAADKTGMAAVKEALFKPEMRKWTILAMGMVGVVAVLLIKAVTAETTTYQPGAQKAVNPLSKQEVKTTEIGDLNDTEREQVLLVKEQYNRELAAETEAGESSQPLFIPAEEVSLVNDEIDSEGSVGVVPDVEVVDDPVELLPVATETPVQSRRENIGSVDPKMQNTIMKKLVSRKIKYEPIRFETSDNNGGGHEETTATEYVVQNDTELVEQQGIKIVDEMEYVAAQSDFAMSTYFPGPAVFTIISSDPIINRAKVSGSMVEYTPPAKNAAPLIQVQLDRMCLEDGRCFDIQARAFDPATSRFAIASEIDHHWMIRYGFWGLGTIVKSAGVAIQLGSSTTTVEDGVIVQDKSLTARDEVIVGLGILGEEVGDVLSQYLYDPPEVKVNQYERCGIYFQRPVILQI